MTASGFTDVPLSRVVFVDIDGPMIPFSMFLIDRHASLNRTIAPIPIAVLNRLCERSGAKIVFNTTHNISLDDVPDIEVACVNAGLKQEYIHPDMKTKYPSIDRGNSVLEWLHRHPETTDWIAFDDARFTDVDNLIWIDPDAGLHLGHLNQALDRWNCTQFIVL